MQELRHPAACNELKFLHDLIKENFFKVLTTSFEPIPTNTEFYFYRNQAIMSTRKIDKITSTLNNNRRQSDDDEISNPPSEIIVNQLKSIVATDKSNRLDDFITVVSSSSTTTSVGDISPLFLHLICTVKYHDDNDDDGIANTSVRVLPTCLGKEILIIILLLLEYFIFVFLIHDLGELIQNLDATLQFNKKILQVNLGIIHLTLPSDVQNVISDYSLLQQTLLLRRSSSFCSSDGYLQQSSSVIKEEIITDYLQSTDPDE